MVGVGALDHKKKGPAVRRKLEGERTPAMRLSVSCYTSNEVHTRFRVNIAHHSKAMKLGNCNRKGIQYAPYERV